MTQEAPTVWTEADERELRERLQALSGDPPEDVRPVEWNPMLESELRYLLRKVAIEERGQLLYTPALRELEGNWGLPRIPAPDGSDMEERLLMWESWLIRRLPERLLGPFLKCAGLTEDDIRPPKKPRKKTPRVGM